MAVRGELPGQGRIVPPAGQALQRLLLAEAFLNQLAKCGCLTSRAPGPAVMMSVGTTRPERTSHGIEAHRGRYGRF